jgi:lysophospholipase L1-like esterase
MPLFLCFLAGLSLLNAGIIRNDPPPNIPQVLNIVTVGDSLSKDVAYSAANQYPGQLATLYGAAADITNSGVGGQTVVQMQANIATQANAFFLVGQRPNVAVVWGGTNDLDFGTQDATKTYNSIVAYCQSLRAYGFFVAVLTLLPRTDAGFPSNFEANRQTVNTNLRNNWQTFANTIYDCAADNRFSDSTNTAYFRDLVHLTVAGYAIIAAGVKAAIDPLGLVIDKSAASAKYYSNSSHETNHRTAHRAFHRSSDLRRVGASRAQDQS